MKVEQVYALANDIITQVTGKSDLLMEDLSNTVDVGKTLDATQQMDNYIHKLINHIGKVEFHDRVYSGRAPKLIRKGWEYGSILQKIYFELPDAVENKAWELVEGETYNQDIFHGANVSMKLFNSRTSFQVTVSLPEYQIKESFQSAGQMASFFAGIINAINTLITRVMDGFVMRALNNMTALTILDAFDGVAPTSADTSVRAVNLLKLYKDRLDPDSTLTPEGALTDAEFIRFASFMMNLTAGRLGGLSTLYNIEGKVRHTPKDKLNIIMLGEFSAAADIYLQSDTYHKELTSFPKFQKVDYWQGSGQSNQFEAISGINVTAATSEAEVLADTGTPLAMSGILAVMYDEDAVAVANEAQRVKQHNNAVGDFVNNFYKIEAMFLNDTSQNGVVFFVA